MNNFATASRPLRRPEVSKALQERIGQQEEQDRKLSQQKANSSSSAGMLRTTS